MNAFREPPADVNEPDGRSHERRVLDFWSALEALAPPSHADRKLDVPIPDKSRKAGTPPHRAPIKTEFRKSAVPLPWCDPDHQIENLFVRPDDAAGKSVRWRVPLMLADMVRSTETIARCFDNEASAVRADEDDVRERRREPGKGWATLAVASIDAGGLLVPGSIEIRRFGRACGLVYRGDFGALARVSDELDDVAAAVERELTPQEATGARRAVLADDLQRARELERMARITDLQAVAISDDLYRRMTAVAAVHQRIHHRLPDDALRHHRAVLALQVALRQAECLGQVIENRRLGAPDQTEQRVPQVDAVETALGIRKPLGSGHADVVDPRRRQAASQSHRIAEQHESGNGRLVLAAFVRDHASKCLQQLLVRPAQLFGVRIDFAPGLPIVILAVVDRGSENPPCRCATRHRGARSAFRGRSGWQLASWITRSCGSRPLRLDGGPSDVDLATVRWTLTRGIASAYAEFVFFVYRASV